MTDDPRSSQNAIVIIDREDPSLARYCAWRDLLEGSQDIQVSYLSLYDTRGNIYAPGRMFSADTKFLIFNWDVLNGDPVFGNDIALKLVEHYWTDLRQWVELGGIAILEYQGAAGVPVQDAYSAFTERGKFPIRVDGAGIRGSILSCNQELSGLHPILYRLSGQIMSRHEGRPAVSLFPQPFCDEGIDSVARSVLQPQRLFCGWFRAFHPSWEPILFANIHGKMCPTMLCRLASKDERVGAYLVTTMPLASTSPETLLRNILALPSQLPTYYNRFGNLSLTKKRRRRLLTSLNVTGIPAMIGLTLTFPELKAFWYFSLIAVTGSLLGTLAVAPVRRFVNFLLHDAE